MNQGSPLSRERGLSNRFLGGFGFGNREMSTSAIAHTSRDLDSLQQRNPATAPSVDLPDGGGLSLFNHEVCEIHLPQGLTALVSGVDFPHLVTIRWSVFRPDHCDWYVSTRFPGMRRAVYLHSLVAGYPPGKIEIDHADGNTLNNVRTNIRVCTPQQNRWNRGKRAASTSPFKGVIFFGGVWIARIKAHGKRTSLGTFKSEIEAAHAYDAAARSAYGQYAYLNFPTATDIELRKNYSWPSHSLVPAGIERSTAAWNLRKQQKGAA